MKFPTGVRCLLLAVVAAGCVRAEQLSDATAQARVEQRIAEIRQWAAEPAIVTAVAAQNATLPADYAAMTQAAWERLAELDPIVRSFTRNALGQWLRAKKTDWMGEAFVSDAKGLKVAFLSKPTNWSHAGKPKHDVPMSGKTWQGKIEVDESTRASQLQVAVPILQEGKPIGSLVVGISLAKI